MINSKFKIQNSKRKINTHTIGLSFVSLARRRIFNSTFLILNLSALALTACIGGNGFSGSLQRDNDGNITGFEFNPTQPTPQPIFTELPDIGNLCRKVSLDDSNSYLNVRNNYGQDAQVTNAQLYNGETVTLESITTRKGYVKITKPVTGYISANYLTHCTEGRGHG